MVVVIIELVGVLTNILIIEDGIPGASVVCRFPDATVVRRHVENIRLPRDARDRHGASATKWADHAPGKLLVHGGVILLRRNRNGRQE